MNQDAQECLWLSMPANRLRIFHETTSIFTVSMDNIYIKGFMMNCQEELTSSILHMQLQKEEQQQDVSLF